MSDTDWKGVAYELGWMACGSPASERFDEIVAKHPWVGPTEAQRIQELEAACAAMRDLLQKAKTDITVHRYSTALRCIDKALATDAGKAMLERLARLELETFALPKHDMERAADQVRAQAYEECAQVAEAIAEKLDTIGQALAAASVVAAIRAKAKSGPEGT